MNLKLLYQEWGIDHDIATMLNVTQMHRGATTHLFHLGRILNKAYSPKEVPDILKRHSEVLGGSMINYMEDVQFGAADIVDLIEHA